MSKLEMVREYHAVITQHFGGDFALEIQFQLICGSDDFSGFVDVNLRPAPGRAQYSDVTTLARLTDWLPAAV